MYTNKTRRYLVIALAIGWICAIAYFLIRGKVSENKLYRDKRVAMGTFVEVISPYPKAAKIVFNELARIEGLLSKYKPDSEISKLNKFGVLKVSPETFYIVKKAKEFYFLSQGAFDISVAPLMDLWGFTDWPQGHGLASYGQSHKSEDSGLASFSQSHRHRSLPYETKIKEVLKLVGSDKIILHDIDNVVQFKLPGMKIDLGAIAKGYAVDCAVNKLKEAGIRSCLINAGGQIYCLGNNFGRPWKVAIKDPRGRSFLGYLELRDKAVATSGDYEQYFLKNNSRYGHIFNPKTGCPVKSKIISVTVIADDGLTADALSTSIFVLGKKKGEALAFKFKDVQTKIIEDSNSPATERTPSG